MMVDLVVEDLVGVEDLVMVEAKAILPLLVHHKVITVEQVQDVVQTDQVLAVAEGPLGLVEAVRVKQVVMVVQVQQLVLQQVQ
jgi:hypothetical protein